MQTAILVDGAFYRKRAKWMLGDTSPERRADELAKYCMQHIKHEASSLYRVFYYDCPPTARKVLHPLTNEEQDLSQTRLYEWMRTFINELKKKRKFALRLGKLSEEQARYTLRPDVIRSLCNGELNSKDLQERDFYLDVPQKGVDMKIGLDIASLAYKRLVGQIVLISGDSDFVPAAKLARREGIDFILDPLFHPIKPDLFEHIDGLHTCDNRFRALGPGVPPYANGINGVGNMGAINTYPNSYGTPNSFNQMSTDESDFMNSNLTMDDDEHNGEDEDV